MPSGKDAIKQHQQDHGKVLEAMRYLHPLVLIDLIVENTWPLIEGHFESLSDDCLILLDKLFNLVAAMAVHIGYRYFSLMLFSQLMIVIGVAKRLLVKRKEQIRLATIQMPQDQQAPSSTGTYLSKLKEEQSARRANKGVYLDVDHVEEFCVRNLKPSLDWLNTLIRTLWLNYRAYVKFKFLYDIWPSMKRKLEETPLNNLGELLQTLQKRNN